jgi:hypothetical protein
MPKACYGFKTADLELRTAILAYEWGKIPRY